MGAADPKVVPPITQRELAKMIVQLKCEATILCSCTAEIELKASSLNQIGDRLHHISDQLLTLIGHQPIVTHEGDG